MASSPTDKAPPLKASPPKASSSKASSSKASAAKTTPAKPTGKTLTRADLSARVYEDVGLSLSEATLVVDSVIEEMVGALAAGETVKVSSFGTFTRRKKKERIGRNPKTREEVPITPRTVLSFNASNLLKKQVNDALHGKAKP